MSDLDSANLCARIYQPDAATDPFWSHYWNQDGIVCGHVVTDGVDDIVFRGSDNIPDWIRDVDAIPIWDKKLGFVHAGFNLGLNDLYQSILKVVGNKIRVKGHSFGAAHACELAGYFAYDAASAGVQCPVIDLCTFGQPKPAFANLGRIIAKSGMRHVSYRNRNDPVPLVPPPFPFPFENTEPWISLDAAPEPTDLEPLRDHHIMLYVKGVQSLAPG
jgi:hypothetical protein